MSIFYLLTAVGIGICFAAQPAVNGAVAQVFGSFIPAAAMSILITLICLVVWLVASGTSPSSQSVANLPWWSILGGMIGVGVVAGGAAIVPITGAAVFFVCMIAGQLAGSVLIDHFGAFRMPVAEISLMKLAGLGCALLGVILVRYG